MSLSWVSLSLFFLFFIFYIFLIFFSAVGRQPCSPQLTVLLLSPSEAMIQIWTWSEKQGSGSKDGCHQYRSAESNAHPCFPHGVGQGGGYS